MSIILEGSLATISIEQVTRGPLVLGNFPACFLAGKKSQLQNTTEGNLRNDWGLIRSFQMK
jgi:hypothetical protein